MGWDKGLGYEYLRRLIERKRRSTKSRLTRCYCSILLIQLRNGLRISEAVRAYQQYLRTKERELEVPVSKKKKPELRKVIIDFEPDECPELLSVPEELLNRRVRVWCKTRFKVNTHTIRYAFVTYLLKKGVSPALIAKITKHSKLDYILTYTQERAAEEVLRRLGPA